MSEPVFKVKCPGCGAEVTPIYDAARGEYICPLCGYVLEEYVIDRGKYWRAYTPEQEAMRVSAARIKGGVDTTPFTIKMKHVRGYRKLEGKKERDKKYEAELVHMAKRLGVPEYVVGDAVNIFNRAKNSGLFRGRSYIVLMAAAIYAASKRYKHYVTPQVIEESLGIKAKAIVKTYSLLVQKGIVVSEKGQGPGAHIPFILGRLNTGRKLLSRHLTQMMNFANELRRDVFFQGKKPRSLAAAVVYIFSVMLSCKVSQRDIAEAAGVAPPTIRRVSAEISKRLEVVVEI